MPSRVPRGDSRRTTVLASNYRAIYRYRSAIRYLVIRKILRADAHARARRDILMATETATLADCSEPVAQRRKHTRIAG